jgi:hypothetical protein
VKFRGGGSEGGGVGVDLDAEILADLCWFLMSFSDCALVQSGRGGKQLVHGVVGLPLGGREKIDHVRE